MGGSPPAAPAPPPPPSVTAAAQTGQNVFSGLTNQYGGQVDLSTPYGNVNYNQIGSKDFTDPNSGTVYTIPKYQENVGLTSEGQSILNPMVQTQKTAANQALAGLTGADYGGTPASEVVGDSTSGNTKAQLDKYLSYYQPLNTMQTQQLDTQLRNQGIEPDSPAYTNQMRNLQDQISRNTTNAGLGFEQTAYNQAMTNYLTPLQVAEAEFGNSQPNMPGAVQTPQSGFSTQPTNYAGIQAGYNNAVNQNYAAQMQGYAANQAGLGAMFSPLARAFAGFGSAGV